MNKDGREFRFQSCGYVTEKRFEVEFAEQDFMRVGPDLWVATAPRQEFVTDDKQIAELEKIFKEHLTRG